MIVTLLLPVTGCSGGPGPPPSTTAPESPVVSSVELPAPDRRGETVTVDGQADWQSGQPGCARVRTGGGQVFQLSGPAVDLVLHEVRSGSMPARQQVRLSGYIPPVGASACGAVRTFVVERLTVAEQ